MHNKILKFVLSLVIVSSTLSFNLYARSRWVKVGDNWRYELHEGGGNFVTEK